MTNQFEFNHFNKKETVGVEESMPELLFGKNLRITRNAAGLSMSDLANRLGMTSSSSVKTWETGDTFPEEFRLRDIAMLCNIDFNKLKEWYDLSKSAHEKFVEAKKFTKEARGVVDKTSEVYLGGSTGGIRRHYKTAR